MPVCIYAIERLALTHSADKLTHVGLGILSHTEANAPVVIGRNILCIDHDDFGSGHLYIKSNETQSENPIR
mgnify:CR=1 FL=1